MLIKYNIKINTEDIIKHIDRLTNQIFKLLPSREEKNDWETPLENLIVEIGGMNELLNDHYILFLLLCKMEALRHLTKEEDFLMFRKVIFECLGLMNELKRSLQCVD